VQVRATLHRADPVLALAGKVTGRLAPGVTEVRRLAAPLDGVLASLRTVGPDARSTLRTLRGATPSLNPLLSRATTLLPKVRSIGAQATKALTCIRPYTPDIIGFASLWSDYLNNEDGHDTYFRAQIQVPLDSLSNATPYNSGTLHRLMPEVKYAYPQPPGYPAGQPWMLPECGITEDSLNPDKDPEARNSPVQLGPAPVNGGTP
jgi:phospholipid/cholesterol/gamma-HCH transport system substrate-binding protein